MGIGSCFVTTSGVAGGLIRAKAWHEHHALQGALSIQGPNGGISGTGRPAGFPDSKLDF